jgi:hypothetical protein
MRTKKNDGKGISHLLDAMKNSINEIGLTKTIYILENKKETIELKSKDIRFAIETVCEVFGIEDYELFSEKKKYPRKYAFAVWVYLCIHILKLKYDDLVITSDKAKITLQKAKHFIDNYPNETHFDKKMVHEKLQKSIEILNTKKSKL